MKHTVFALIDKELHRQQNTISLIASENYASHEVLAATGSVLTNKYAEGYPGKRYYAGCQVIDEIEQYAISRARELFCADHANVQPHAGSQANFAVYLSCLKPGDTILGMSLAAGGHLTHGHAVNLSGKLFNIVSYGVSPENEQLDYDEIELLAQQHQPKLIIAGASAYPRAIDFIRIAEIAKNSGALFMADIAHIAGLVATGLHQSPIPVANFVTTTTHKTLRGPRGGMILCKAEHAKAIDLAVMPGTQGGPLMHSIAAKAVAFDEALSPAFKEYQKKILANAHAMATEFKQRGYKLVSGGTDNHLFLINLKESTAPGITKTGKEAEETLEKCGIILNRNAVPFDTERPFITSGIRIGTPAMTTRGMHGESAVQLVDLIDTALKNHDNEKTLQTVSAEVRKMCALFPVYAS